MIEEEEVDDKKGGPKEKKNNVLPLWGNERSMNLNPLILTNIQSSHYFKVNLYELKTYHEVIDEIYYKVIHLEPWEKGSRKTAGQTGMCGGVRGVGAGGIVSTAFCLLYKLFTLKLTRKQVNGLITHPDSPYIRALGFMYIRYTQPPADLFDWFDEYLEDPEEMDVKAGGGQVMCIGDILKHYLTKLEWFSTLFPRIPVPIQQKIEKRLNAKFPPQAPTPAVVVAAPQPQLVSTGGAQPSRNHATSRPPRTGSRDARHIPDDELSFGEAERVARLRRTDTQDGRSPSQGQSRERTSGSPHPTERRDRERERDRRGSRTSSPSRGARRDHRRSRERDRERDRGERGEVTRERSSRRGSSRDRGNGHYSREERGSHRSHRDEQSRHGHRSSKDFASELAREKERQKKERDRSRVSPHIRS